MEFQLIFDGFLMDIKFWGAAPGGFFENPTIFGVLGSFFRVLGFGWYVGPILGIPFRAFFFPPVKLVKLDDDDDDC